MRSYGVELLAEVRVVFFVLVVLYIIQLPKVMFINFWFQVLLYQ